MCIGDIKSLEEFNLDINLRYYFLDWRWQKLCWPFSDKPSPPRDLKVTEVQREAISVAWEKPEDDGGSPITQYILEKRDAKKTTWSSAGKAKPTELAQTISKLIEGNEYFIRVIAENEIGQSEPCELKDPVKAKSQFGEYFVHVDSPTLLVFYHYITWNC
jgi:hypothetical protein